MSKFDERVRQLTAVNEVASTIEYYLKDCEESSEDYLERAREAAKESGCETEFLEDDYRVDNAKSYQRKAEVWKQLMAYLEKQYL